MVPLRGSPSALRLPAPRRGSPAPALALLTYHAALLAALLAVEQALTSFGLRNGSSDAAPWRLALSTLGSMLGAVALTLPITWIYGAGSPAGGKDLTVLETLVLLPAAVSAIVRIVQDNVSLALSLAGIVAAVRFRNTLKESADAVYVFVSIGLGLAAGIQALVTGVVISGVFSAIALATAKGRIEGEPRVPPSADLRRLSATRDDSERSKARRKVVLLVHGTPRQPAWRAVEDVLRKRAKRWRLVELPGTSPDTPLEYRIRLRRKTSAARLLEEVKRRGGSQILTAELLPGAEIHHRASWPTPTRWRKKAG